SPYGATKSALNLIGINLYSELPAEGFPVLLIHLGLVRTDMSSSAGTRTPTLAAAPSSAFASSSRAASLAVLGVIESSGCPFPASCPGWATNDEGGEEGGDGAKEGGAESEIGPDEEPATAMKSMALVEATLLWG
ncbi:unnamed protein product, partial [Tilletia controversa]